MRGSADTTEIAMLCIDKWRGHRSLVVAGKCAFSKHCKESGCVWSRHHGNHELRKLCPKTLVLLLLKLEVASGLALFDDIDA